MNGFLKYCICSLLLTCGLGAIGQLMPGIFDDSPLEIFSSSPHMMKLQTSHDKRTAFDAPNGQYGGRDIAEAENVSADEARRLRRLDAIADDRYGRPTQAPSAQGNSGDPSIAHNGKWVDPSAEDRISAMNISEKLKRQILDNYRRTGILPASLQTGDRTPAAAQ